MLAVPIQLRIYSRRYYAATQWTSRVSLDRNFERNVTKSEPNKALKLIERGKLTLNERVVLHRVVWTGVTLMTLFPTSRVPFWVHRARNSPISQVYINDFCSRPRRARPDTVLTATMRRCWSSRRHNRHLSTSPRRVTESPVLGR